MTENIHNLNRNHLAGSYVLPEGNIRWEIKDQTGHISNAGNFILKEKEKFLEDTSSRAIDEMGKIGPICVNEQSKVLVLGVRNKSIDETISFWTHIDEAEINENVGLSGEVLLAPGTQLMIQLNQESAKRWKVTFEKMEGKPFIWLTTNEYFAEENMQR